MVFANSPAKVATNLQNSEKKAKYLVDSVFYSYLCDLTSKC